MIESLVTLDNAHILELGCGAADMTQQLVQGAPTVTITASEVDQIQHEKNLRLAIDRVRFKKFAAEAIDEPAHRFDGVMMFKSLHHVPLAQLDKSFSEICRVLKPGGWLYISEPVFAGAFNDVIRIFHDEEHVRREAFSATERAVAGPDFELQAQKFFKVRIKMLNFQQFEDRLLNVTHTDHRLTDEQLAEVRRRFESNRSEAGYVFDVPMRVDVLRSVSSS